MVATTVRSMIAAESLIIWGPIGGFWVYGVGGYRRADAFWLLGLPLILLSMCRLQLWYFRNLYLRHG